MSKIFFPNLLPLPSPSSTPPLHLLPPPPLALLQCTCGGGYPWTSGRSSLKIRLSPCHCSEGTRMLLCLTQRRRREGKSVRAYFLQEVLVLDEADRLLELGFQPRSGVLEFTTVYTACESSSSSSASALYWLTYPSSGKL